MEGGTKIDIHKATAKIMKDLEKAYRSKGKTRYKLMLDGSLAVINWGK